MNHRLTVLSLLTLGLAVPVAAQEEQPAPAYPPGNYQPQPGQYPQQYPQPQPGQYPQQYPQQPGQYPPGAYPSPLAADPNAAQPAYPPGAYAPGYGAQYQAPEQMVSSVDGALQLGLGTYFMRFTSASREFDDANVEDSITELRWGLGEHSPVNLEIAYGITDRLLIGGVLQLGGRSATFEREGFGEAEESDFDLLIGPKIEFQFLPTSKFNPYAGAVLALESHSDEAGPQTGTSHLLFNMQIRGGVRYFVSENVSIDPSLAFGFAFGGGSEESMGMEFDYGLSGFRIALGLAVSAWLR